MNRIVPLRDGEGTDLERWLLESATEDAPPLGSREQALLAIGLGTVAASGSSAALNAAGSAKALATGAGAASSAKSAGTVAMIAVLKWFGVGAAVGAVVAAGVATATKPLVTPKKTTTDVVRTPSPEPKPPATALNALTPPSEMPSAVPEPDAELRPVPDIPSASDTARAPVHASGSTLVNSGQGTLAAAPPPAAREPVPGKSTVVDEVESLDRARAALASGEPLTALERLAVHEERFAGGALEPEAVVLRVRALLDFGQHDRAVTVAQGFLAAHPASAQAARLRTLLGK